MIKTVKRTTVEEFINGELVKRTITEEIAEEDSPPLPLPWTSENESIAYLSNAKR